MEQFEAIVALIAELLPALIGVISCIITFIRTGKVSTIYKEVEELKYRLPNYREKQQAPAETYAVEIPQYKLNKATGQLIELPVKKNISEEINSYKDLALSAAIERFMPVDVDTENPVIDAYEYNADRLEVFLQAQNYKEELAQKYGYSLDMSLQDMINDLTAKNQKIADTLKQATIKQEVKTDESKENE